MGHGRFQEPRSWPAAWVPLRQEGSGGRHQARHLPLRQALLPEGYPAWPVRPLPDERRPHLRFTGTPQLRVPAPEGPAFGTFFLQSSSF